MISFTNPHRVARNAPPFVGERLASPLRLRRLPFLMLLAQVVRCVCLPWATHQPRTQTPSGRLLSALLTRAWQRSHFATSEGLAFLSLAATWNAPTPKSSCGWRCRGLLAAALASGTGSSPGGLRARALEALGLGGSSGCGSGAGASELSGLGFSPPSGGPARHCWRNRLAAFLSASSA